MPLNILVVEDELLFQETMREALAPYGEIQVVSTITQAHIALKHNHFDITFVDLNLESDLDGLSIVRSSFSKGIYTVILSSEDCHEVSERIKRIGCHRYFVKGTREDNKKSVEDTIATFHLKQNHERIHDFFEHEFICKNRETQKEISRAIKRASSNISIFIHGETGVGKSFLARKLHELSGRPGPFIEINCGAFQEQLLLSEMFGHIKGAFTGATSGHEGKMQAAHQGTLFLDEINSIPYAAQTMLLSAIDNKRFCPVGSSQEIHSDFRIISASHLSFDELLHSPEMRDDFVSRVAGIEVMIPPLRHRSDDIEAIIQKIGYPKGSSRWCFSDEAIDLLCNHTWKRNTRELVQVVNAIIESKQFLVTPELLEEIDPRSFKKDFSPRSNSDHEALFQAIHEAYQKEHGVNLLVKKFEFEAIKNAIKNNNNRVVSTLNSIGVSRKKWYELKRIFGENL